MDEKPISASDIVKNPDITYQFTNCYILVKDTSILATYKNLIEAVNILAEHGWETVGIANDGSGNMYAMCRNTHYKFKNQPTHE